VKMNMYIYIYIYNKQWTNMKVQIKIKMNKAHVEVNRVWLRKNNSHTTIVELCFFSYAISM
jgi:putative IMPACT (imprinted ancient) family translation regulator